MKPTFSILFTFILIGSMTDSKPTKSNKSIKDPMYSYDLFEGDIKLPEDVKKTFI